MDTKSSEFASYREFIEYFAAHVDPTDQLPVRVPNYSLNESELTGAIIDWILQYLNDKWVIDGPVRSNGRARSAGSGRMIQHIWINIDTFP